jgi:hypothetical protein
LKIILYSSLEGSTGRRQGLKRDLKKAWQQAKLCLCNTLLAETGFSIEKMALTTETSVYFVRKIKASLSNTLA